MIRRRQPRIRNANSDRWLVSYADFMTLLFGFFVVMYSVSQVNEEAYRQLAQGLGATFAIEDGAGSGADSDFSVAQGENEQTPPKLVSPQALAEQIRVLLDELITQGQVAVTATEDWAEITVNANLLFASARAEPSAEAREVFAQLAALLAPYDNAVEVSGHTDSQPISNDSFGNNWELSAARATAVVALLTNGGIAPERLAATGYGEFRPVADNTNEAARARNRRVVLMVARHRAERPTVAAEDVPALLGDVPAGEIQAREALAGDPQAEALLASPPPASDATNLPMPVVEPVVREDGSLLFTNDPKKSQDAEK